MKVKRGGKGSLVGLGEKRMEIIEKLQNFKSQIVCKKI